MTYVPKYPKTPYWPGSPSVEVGDRVHTNPEIFVGRPVVITEKLDGGNTCLFNGEVYARSTSQPSHAGWMAMVRKHHAYKTLIDCRSPRFYYGEDLYGIHSIKYDHIKESETFRLFAIREGDIFRRWDVVESEAEILDVPTVPIRYQLTFKSVDEITELLNNSITQGSALGGECEGFVIRIADQFEAKDFDKYVAKYVRPNHVQTDEHWTKNWQPCKLIR